MKIEIKTEAHTEWSPDTVAFEDRDDVVEITHNEGYSFEVNKRELLKVVSILCD